MSSERLAQRADERVDLAPLGGDLTRVGEALVVGAAVDAQRAQLAVDPLALGRQLGAPVRVGRLGHGADGTPRLELSPVRRPGRRVRSVAACARGCAASYDGSQPLRRHLRVHLRRRDAGVAEQLLHDAQVGAVVEHVGRARVPQHVRRQLRVEPDPLAGAAHDRPARLPRDAAAACVEHDRVGVARARGARAAQREPPVAQVRRRRAARAPRPIGTTRSLSPLPSTRSDAVFEVEVVEVEADRLADADAGAVEQSRAARGRAAASGSSPVTAPSSRSTSSSSSAFGMPCGTRGAPTSSLGSRRRDPSRAQNRWNDRTATTRPRDRRRREHAAGRRRRSSVSRWRDVRVHRRPRRSRPGRSRPARAGTRRSGAGRGGTRPASSRPARARRRASRRARRAASPASVAGTRPVPRAPLTSPQRGRSAGLGSIGSRGRRPSARSSARLRRTPRTAGAAGSAGS